MTKAEIKQAIKKEKPKATLLFADNKKLAYHTMLLSGKMILFNVHYADMGDENRFRSTMDAKDLLKWITKEI